MLLLWLIALVLQQWLVPRLQHNTTVPSLLLIATTTALATTTTVLPVSCSEGVQKISIHPTRRRLSNTVRAVVALSRETVWLLCFCGGAIGVAQAQRIHSPGEGLCRNRGRLWFGGARRGRVNDNLLLLLLLVFQICVVHKQRWPNDLSCKGYCRRWWHCCCRAGRYCCDWRMLIR